MVLKVDTVFTIVRMSALQETHSSNPALTAPDGGLPRDVALHPESVPSPLPLLVPGWR